MMTLNLILNHKGIHNEIMTDGNVPFYIIFWKSTKTQILEILKEIKYTLEDLSDLNIIYDITAGAKYDKYVPDDLKKKKYIYDVLNLEGLKQGLEI